MVDFVLHDVPKHLDQPVRRSPRGDDQGIEIVFSDSTEESQCLGVDGFQECFDWS